MTPTTAAAGDLRVAAARDTVPVALSIAPFALVIGATATEGGITPVANGIAAAGIFSGSGHLSVLATLVAGGGAFAALGTAALVNSRLLLYGAALQPRFRGQPRWFRWWGPALVVDQTYAMVLARTDLDDPGRFRRYWTTAGATLATSWVAAIVLGGMLGPLLPPGSPLDAAAVVVLAGMLTPRLRRWRPAVVALTALAVAVLAAPLPGGLGLVAGMVAGLGAGALVDRTGSPTRNDGSSGGRR